MTYCPQCKMQRKIEYVNLYENEHISASTVAKLAGVHENTVFNWLRKHKKNGLSGLAEKSRAPKTHPNEYSRTVKETIRVLRREGLANEKRHLGPAIIAHRLWKRYGITASLSGIGKFLHTDGLIPPGKKRRRPKKERIKRCMIHEPGELIQLDVKYAVKSYAGYWYFEYDAIDYVTGIVFGDIYEIQSNLESTMFLDTVAQRAPFQIVGTQTDNHSTFTNYYTGYTKSADPAKPRLHAFDRKCQELGMIHYLIDPGKPSQNGKIERFHRTVEDDFYQQETFKDLNSLRKKFRDFLHYYNHEREHSSINYLTPIEKLRTFSHYAKIKEIIN